MKNTSYRIAKIKDHIKKNKNYAHLGQEIAGAVDDLGLSREAVDALHVAVELYYSRYSVEVAQLIWYFDMLQADRQTGRQEGRQSCCLGGQADLLARRAGRLAG